MIRVWLVLLGLALGAAGMAAAQPFQAMGDGGGGVWVVDRTTGAVGWCRLVSAPAAKLIDVFPNDASVRPSEPRPGRPVCDTVRPASGDGPDMFDGTGFLATPEAQAWLDDPAGYGDGARDGGLSPWQTRNDVGGGTTRGDVGARPRR